MLRKGWCHMLLLLAPITAWAQDPGTPPPTALTLTRSITAPYSRTQLMDKAVEAWERSFGREQGAQLLLTDRENGLLEASGHFNFRSKTLTAREETMGRLSYRLRIHVQHGECRSTITQFKHTGNRGALRGGIDMGVITREGPPLARPKGLSPQATNRIVAELRDMANTEGDRLLRAYENRLREGLGP